MKAAFNASLITLFLALLTACQTNSVRDSENPAAGFVMLPAGENLQIDVRYFSSDNFVGEPITGYQAEAIYLTEPTLVALQNVLADAADNGFGLKVFDAYRPQQAVDHFVRWAEDLSDTRMKSRFYPDVDKANLFRDGYIAAQSGHSRGSTVDLTLFDLGTGEELDMGTPWDFFDLASWGESDEVNAQQRANRDLLRELMTSHGFIPIEQEWWHFSLENEPFPDTYFDFPVR